METAAKSTFGPYWVQNVIAVCDIAELTLAMLFVPDGTKPVVVLRRVRNENVDKEKYDQKFLEHAARYAVLRHPNIAEVKDLGTLEDRCYLATEYVRGKSLLSALAACGRLGLGFPTDIALYIVTKMLEALEYAHGFKKRDGTSLGVVHRDIRHSNVLLATDGAVKISDFEMAFASTHLRTARGVCIGGRQGYFSYLAPEQVREPNEVDPRTDVFSVGIVLYELVTGRHLFSDRSEELLINRLQQGQYELPIARYRPDLHPELESIIRTALAHDAADRFGSATAFLQALHGFLGSVGVAPGPDGLRDLMERLFPPDAEEQE